MTPEEPRAAPAYAARAFGLKQTSGMPQGAEQRPQGRRAIGGPSRGLPITLMMFKPLNVGVCRLHKVHPYSVGTADPGPPMARALSQCEGPLQARTTRKQSSPPSTGDEPPDIVRGCAGARVLVHHEAFHAADMLAFGVADIAPLDPAGAMLRNPPLVADEGAFGHMSAQGATRHRSAEEARTRPHSLTRPPAINRCAPPVHLCVGSAPASRLATVHRDQRPAAATRPPQAQPVPA